MDGLRRQLADSSPDVVWRVVRSCITRIEVWPDYCRVYYDLPWLAGDHQGGEYAISSYPQREGNLLRTLPLEQAPVPRRLGRVPGTVQPRLTEHQRAIRAMYAEGLSLTEIAVLKGISPQRVHQIIAG